MKATEKKMAGYDMLSIYVPKELSAKIKKLAWRRERTFSKLMREIIQAEVAKGIAAGEIPEKLEANL